MNAIHYFDNNATTRVAPEVVEAMLPFFSERYGNASSMHAFGGAVHADMEAARAKVAAFLHCAPEEVVFTSCGSESDNHAIFGTVESLGPATTVITSAVEHPAVLQPCAKLVERGHRVVRVGVHKDGTLDMEQYRAALANPGPKLVTLMWANNETGVIFPLAECAALAKEAGAVFHTDATQAAGKLPEVDMSAVAADMLSFSGHKLHAPKGYCRILLLIPGVVYPAAGALDPGILPRRIAAAAGVNLTAVLPPGVSALIHSRLPLT